MIFYSTPGLSGLELWHAVSNGVSLGQLRHSKREYFAGLRTFLMQLQAGGAAVDDPAGTRQLQAAAGFHTVVFCGGEALDPMLPEALAGPLPFHAVVDRSGPFAAARGAARIFDEFRFTRGVAIDLGQSQLKVIGEAGTRCFPRDPSLLPFGADALPPETGRLRLRDFVRSALAGLSPDGIVLGLPVALAPDGDAQPATYPGLFGPVEPIFDALFECPWVVVNDAVLAARGFEPEQPGRTLVVTLGFGIGGALWEK